MGIWARVGSEERDRDRDVLVSSGVVEAIPELDAAAQAWIHGEAPHRLAD